MAVSQEIIRLHGAAQTARLSGQWGLASVFESQIKKPARWTGPRLMTRAEAESRPYYICPNCHSSVPEGEACGCEPMEAA